MSQESLINKIAADANKEIEAIEAKAAADVQAIEEATAAEVKALKDAAAVSTEKEKNHQTLVLTSKATQAGNIKVQSAKRAAIETVLSGAYQQLVALPSDEYVAFFTKEVQSAIESGVEVVEVEAPANREAETKKILTSIHERATFTSSTTIDAGLILHTNDGVYDLTLKRLFTEKEASLEGLIVSQLGV